MKKLFSDALYVFTCVLPVLFLTASGFSALSVVLAVFLALALSVGVRFAVPFLVPKAAEKTVLFIACATGVSLAAIISRFFPSMDGAALYYMPLCIASAFLLSQKRRTGDNKTVEVLSLVRLFSMFSVLVLAMGIIREFFGAGRFFSLPVTVNFLPPMEAFSKPTGALLIAALVFALFSFLARKEGGENE